VVLHGRLEGNVRGLERVELKKSCVVTGDISTQRIVIEDGAFFKGAVDLQKEARPEQRKAAAATSYSVTPSTSNIAETAGKQQASFLEQK